VHVHRLVGFQPRTRVMVQWVWRYVTFEHRTWLID
jgi:NADH dehydrogenase